MIVSNALLFILLCTSIVSTLPTALPKPIRLPLQTIKSQRRYQKRSEDISIPLINDIDLSELVVRVNVGTPAQEFLLLFDTGSADTWVPSSQCTLNTGCPEAMHRFHQDASTTYQALSENINITYGIGSAHGHYFKDVISLEGTEPIQQTLALIDRSVGPLSNQDTSTDADHVLLGGIFGAGLPEGTVMHLHGGQSYDPFIVALYKSGHIPEPVFSVAMPDLDNQAQDSGSVLLGSIHESKGQLIYTHVVQTLSGKSSTATRWSAYVQGFQFQTATESKNFKFNVPTPFAIDTGSNFMYLPTPLAMDLATAISNGTYEIEDKETGISSLDCIYQDSVDVVKIFFPSASHSAVDALLNTNVFITVPIKDLISKRESDGKCLLLFLPSNDKCILGNMLLRKFITVFDFGEKPRIGFAPS